MLFANLIGIVCAACMAVAPAVSEFENNAVSSAENTSFVRSPKMAYYDPAETYTTTAGKIGNYTSYKMVMVSPYDQETMNQSVASGAVSTFSIEIDYDGIIAYSFEFGDLALNSPFDVDDCYLGPLDWYIDGELVEFELNTDEVGYPVYMFDTLGTFDSLPYVWVFDHQEAPTNAGVEILGDIAEGITGGIVPVAEGIGQGLQDLVSNIFLDGDGLSIFGIVAVCFAGLALAFGLSRWIVNFVSSLGARDR